MFFIRSLHLVLYHYVNGRCDLFFRSRLNSDVFIQSLNSIFSANFDPAVPSSCLVDLLYLDFNKLYSGTELRLGVFRCLSNVYLNRYLLYLS